MGKHNRDSSQPKSRVIKEAVKRQGSQPARQRPCGAWVSPDLTTAHIPPGSEHATCTCE